MKQVDSVVKSEGSLRELASLVQAIPARFRAEICASVWRLPGSANLEGRWLTDVLREQLGLAGAGEIPILDKADWQPSLAAEWQQRFTQLGQTEDLDRIAQLLVAAIAYFDGRNGQGGNQ